MSEPNIIDRSGSFRLIEQGGRFAIVEVRGDRIFSLDPERNATQEGAPDTPDGMVKAVGPHGWSDEGTARRRFAELSARGEDLARSIW